MILRFSLIGCVFLCLGMTPMAAVVQTMNMYSIADPYVGGGWDNYVDAAVATATVTRDHAGVGLFMTTNSLPRGVYTMWVAAYHDPSQCSNAASNPFGKCDIVGDALNRENSALMRVGANVVDDQGMLTISAWLPKDDALEQLAGSEWGTLKDSFESEIHIFLVWHGEPLELGDGTSMGSLESQFRSFSGGCEFYRVNGGMDPPPAQFELPGFDEPVEFCPMIQGAVSPSVPKTDVKLATVQGASMYDITDPYSGGGFSNLTSPQQAFSSLHRSNEGLGLYLKTQGLPRGTYSVWMSLYNDPSQCANDGMNPFGECDAVGDMLNSNVSTVIRIGSDVVCDCGELSISVWLPKNDASSYLPGSLWGTITESHASEVHVTVFLHGEPLGLGDGTSLSSLEAQLNDFEGGCEYYRVNGGMDPPPIQTEVDGVTTEFCPMIQGAVFAASPLPPTISPFPTMAPEFPTNPAPPPTSPPIDAVPRPTQFPTIPTPSAGSQTVPQSTFFLFSFSLVVASISLF